MYHAAAKGMILLAIVAGSVRAETQSRTFCVNCKIFERASLEAAAEHRILFDQGLVYDLPQIDSRYVTVYDPAAQRVILLDRHTQVQSTLSTSDLVKITAQARAAATTPGQQEQLGLTAKVVPSKRVIGYSIQFAGAEYHVSPQKPTDPQIAIEYGRFADLASRLNIVRRRGPPPFARMTLNEYLTAAGEIPLETTLTLDRGGQSEEYRSTVEVGELTDADQATIEEVQGMLSLYREVAIADLP